MASLVNPSNINGNFPIAGQDNDSQGFRDNFTNIRNNFTFIKTEVEDLQSKAILKTALTGLALDNNFLGSQIKNVQLNNFSETMHDWGITSGDIVLDLALGNVHKIYSAGSLSINAVIKNWPTSLQYARVIVYLTISSTSHTLQLPSTITTDLSSIPGLRNRNGSNQVNFTDAGNYIFEFSSVDSGTTVFVRELTTGNPTFRDPNFYFKNIGSGLSGSTHPTGYEIPTLQVGFGNLLVVANELDTVKGGMDSIQTFGAITSFLTDQAGDENSANLKSAGFTVARSRVVDPTAGVAPTETVTQSLQSGDLIGYFNGMGFTGNGPSTNYFQQLGSIQFYANGGASTYGIGGNVVIATKRDGVYGLQPAVVIDNTQSMTVYGNLDVKGVTTYIESVTINLQDKNIVLAKGAASGAQANGGGIAIDTVSANLEYFYTDTTGGIIGGGDRFVFNKAVVTSNTAVSTSSTTGALVVTGGAGIGGNLNVGGLIGLTSTTQSTSPTTGAFTVGGGFGVSKDVYVGGNIVVTGAQDSTGLASGSLQTAGGLSVNLKSFFGGNVVATALTDATTSTTGALVVLGGLGITKALIANGNVTLGNTTQSTYVAGQSTAYTGALRALGGVHIVKTLNIGDDTGAGSIKVHAGTGSTNDVTLGDTTTGAIVVGNASVGRLGGISVVGSMNLGTNAGGTVYLLNKNTTTGTDITTGAGAVPYTTLGGAVGSMTALGGVQVFGNIFIGQPSRDATTGTKNSGNLYVQSGTPAISAGSGAIVIPAVKLPDGTVSAGGMGIAGNLWVNGNVILGSQGDVTGNVVVQSLTPSTTYQTGALVIPTGGLGVGGVTNLNGNLVLGSTTAGLASTKSGALVIPGGGAYIDGKTFINGNVTLTSGTVAASFNSGALVISGTGGLGVGGATFLNGATQVLDATAGGSGTGALVLPNGGASVAGNLFVQGTVQPINAVGASGVGLVSGTAVAQTNFTASLTDITNANFTAEANKSYYFESWIFHDVSGAATKNFSMTFGAGTCNYVVEQNITATGALAVSSASASAATNNATVAGAVTGLITKITGTFYHTAATNVKVQASVSAGTLTVKGSTFFKWTKLN